MHVPVASLICFADSPVVLMKAVNLCSLPASPFTLSIALLTSIDFGNPLFPVMNTLPFRRATKAPVLTVGHQIKPLYSIGVTVATVVR